MLGFKVAQVGQLISDGRYRLIAHLGEGSMGQVYRAYDNRLETEVVLKFPISSDAALNNPELLARFSQEVRSLVKLSHPHIVKIIDVGTFDELPFVVMQYLSGGSLKTRQFGKDGQMRAMSAATLRGWVPAIAKALEFLHQQSHVHRDVKPANIFFDQHGHAYLGDFGLIKALHGEVNQDAGLTGAGLVLGTPNYMAPEVVMGQEFDSRADQYALAMSIHEAIVGRNVMEGPTASATLVNQTTIEPPPPHELAHGVPPALSRVIMKALSKEPRKRYDSCVLFARDLLSNLSAGSMVIAPSSGSSDHATAPSGSSGKTACPRCGTKLALTMQHSGRSGRCSRCGAKGIVEPAANGTVRLRLLDADDDILTPLPTPLPLAGRTPQSGDGIPVRPGPESVPRAARPAGGPPKSTSGKSKARKSGRRKPKGLPWSRIAALGGVVGVVGFIVYFIFQQYVALQGDSKRMPRTDESLQAVEQQRQAELATVAVPTLSLVAGEEQTGLIKEALEQLSASPEANGLKASVETLPAGTAGATILGQGRSSSFQIWAPGSDVHFGTFDQIWRQSVGGESFTKTADIALSPMVFLIWKERKEAFEKGQGSLSLRLIHDLLEGKGWDEIAGHPEWGKFKFGFADPGKSNSGLQFLIMLAYAQSGKQLGLTGLDVFNNQSFIEWVNRFRDAGVRLGPQRTFASDARTLIKEMVRLGPAAVDCVLVPESLAIEALTQRGDAEPRLCVAYPDPTMLNRHPVYVLASASKEQRELGDRLIALLRSEDIQRVAAESFYLRSILPTLQIALRITPALADAGVQEALPHTCDAVDPVIVDAILNLYNNP